MSEKQTQAAQVTAEPPAGEWAMVEIFGHRKVYGFMTEVERFGTKMARIDVYREGVDGPVLTHFYGGGSIFSVIPASEEVCRRMVERALPTPAAMALPLPGAEQWIDEEHW